MVPWDFRLPGLVFGASARSWAEAQIGQVHVVELSRDRAPAYRNKPANVL